MSKNKNYPLICNRCGERYEGPWVLQFNDFIQTGFAHLCPKCKIDMGVKP